MALLVNPSVPYLGSISTPVVPGLMFQFTGQVLDNAKGFAINLKTPTDIAYHWNLRFTEGCVVRNTNLGGFWGPEERAAPSGEHELPFIPIDLDGQQKFEILIMCEAGKFLTSVNGHHFNEYIHRLPLPEVKILEVVGDVQLNMIREVPAVESTSMTPLVYEAGSQAATIPGGLHEGRKLLIYATPTHSDGRKIQTGNVKWPVYGCAINLRCGQGDVAFHLNPRIEHQKLVLSSHLGNWGPDEVSPVMPFKVGTPVELSILCEHDGFQVNLNGDELCKFAHRVPLERINTVEFYNFRVHHVQLF